MRLALLAATAGLLAACTATSTSSADSTVGSTGATSAVPSVSSTASSTTPARTSPAASGTATSHASASTTTTSPGGPATVKTVVRPVTAAGRPAAGFTSSFENGASMACDRAEISPVSVDRAGVYACGSSADDAIACWPAATNDHVLCDHDPFDHVLEERAVSWSTAAASPRPGPVPLGLVLDNGEHCRIRVGGTASAPAQHPDWVAWYFCGSEFGAVVYAPRTMNSTSGIDETRPLWSVSVGRGDGSGSLVKRAVRSAVFVGVAH